MTTTTAIQKDVQKLQRLIADALEDVKAQDIVVFNTEHLSPLFERVIIATGSSNRQTRSLASSVRDKVREAGLPKPRLEGEDNGEWIIVDCGPAVVHIMQPAIRQYYHLEEIWGDKPIRLKLGSPKPIAPVPVKAAALVPAKKRGGAAKSASPAAKKSTKPLPGPVAKSAKAAKSPLAASKTAVKKASPSSARSKPKKP
ncbi:MAG: ribosome silencing factor [Betaproteobacteria bacterium]|jgi:ribosome-associated protein|nr:ribosome silencing factor [Betaproteobacteria bacterium]